MAQEALRGLLSSRTYIMPAGSHAAGDSSATDEGSYRCWICLEDAETIDGMISPCSCVGTNRWVHEDCEEPS